MGSAPRSGASEQASAIPGKMAFFRLLTGGLLVRVLPGAPTSAHSINDLQYGQFSLENFHRYRCACRALMIRINRFARATRTTTEEHQIQEYRGAATFAHILQPSRGRRSD